jgi:HAD superfamily hydrolase (TIGR01450 family)
MPEIQQSLCEWFSRCVTDFDAVVFDIDGVLLIGSHPVPGSVAFIRLLQQMQKPYGLLTNDGDHSHAEKNDYLRRCGFDFKDDDITSCADGLVEVAQSLGLQGQLCFRAGELGVPSYAVAAGLVETRELVGMPDCQAVIIGDGPYDWQKVVNAALNFFIHKPETPLICVNPDEFFPVKGGRIEVGSGSVTRFLQRLLATYGVQKEIIYLGKPYRPIFEHNHHVLERRCGRTLSPRRVLMVGDSLAADIRGGAQFGYRTALMLTGMTKPVHLVADAPAAPDWVFSGY